MGNNTLFIIILGLLLTGLLIWWWKYSDNKKLTHSKILLGKQFNLSKSIENLSLSELQQQFYNDNTLLYVTKTGLVSHYFPSIGKDYISSDSNKCLIVPDNLQLPNFYTWHKAIPMDGSEAFDYFLRRNKPIWHHNEKYYIRILTNKCKKFVPKCVKNNYTTTFYVSESGVTTTLHVDSRPGYIVQLRGRKRIIVFPKEDKKYLYFDYPENHPLKRRSKFDGKFYPGVEKSWPNISQASKEEYILNPDEYIFIPENCPHYVESLDKETISVIVRFTDHIRN